MPRQSITQDGLPLEQSSQNAKKQSAKKKKQTPQALYNNEGSMLSASELNNIQPTERNILNNKNKSPTKPEARKKRARKKNSQEFDNSKNMTTISPEDISKSIKPLEASKQTKTEENQVHSGQKCDKVLKPNEQASKSKKRKLPAQNSNKNDTPTKRTKIAPSKAKIAQNINNNENVPIIREPVLKSLPMLDLDEVFLSNTVQLEETSNNDELKVNSDKTLNKPVSNKKKDLKINSPSKNLAVAKSKAISKKIGTNKSPSKKSPKNIKSPNKSLKKKKLPNALLCNDILSSNGEEEEDESVTKNDDNCTFRAENEYIAEGFKDDCEQFIRKCQCVSKLNYQKFGEVWREMGFAQIYQGRLSGADMAEVSEEVIHVAKSYMVTKERNFEVNVAGLFLVYTLLHFQPFDNFAALRLVPEDVPAILALESEAREQRRHDIIYILGHVLSMGQCQFHVAARECGLEHSLRKYYDGSVQVSDASTQPIGVLSNNSEALSLIKILSTLDRKYSEAKTKLQERTGPDPSLKYTGSTAEELMTSMQRLIPGYISEGMDNIANKDVQSYEDERQDKVKSIKDKAMANTVNPIRHLTGVEERKQNIQTPLSPTYKNRHKGFLKNSFSGKTLNKFFESDTSDDDDGAIEPKWSPKKLKSLLKVSNDEQRANDSDELSFPCTSATSTTAEVQKESTNKPKSKRKAKLVPRVDSTENLNEKSDKDKIKTDAPNVIVNETYIDNHMPSLHYNLYDTRPSPEHDKQASLLTAVPVEIHDNAMTGQEIEVEMLDYYNDTNQTAQAKEFTESSNTAEDFDDKSSEKNENEMILDISGTKNRQDRRGFKRSHIKSTLKKLGLLAVADFTEKPSDNEI